MDAVCVCVCLVNARVWVEITKRSSIFGYFEVGVRLPKSTWLERPRKFEGCCFETFWSKNHPNEWWDMVWNHEPPAFFFGGEFNDGRRLSHIWKSWLIHSETSQKQGLGSLNARLPPDLGGGSVSSWVGRFPRAKAEEESLGQENGNDNQAQCYRGTAVAGWLGVLALLEFNMSWWNHLTQKYV